MGIPATMTQEEHTPSEKVSFSPTRADRAYQRRFHRTEQPTFRSFKFHQHKLSRCGEGTLMGKKLFFSVFLAFFISVSTQPIFAGDRRHVLSPSELFYFLDRAANDYQKSIVLEVLKRRIPGFEVGIQPGLTDQESARFKHYRDDSCGSPLYAEFQSIVSSLNDDLAGEIAYLLATKKPSHLDKKIDALHFEVWYTDDASNSDWVKKEEAQLVTLGVELAYESEVTKWGYKTPGSVDEKKPGTQSAKYQVWIMDLLGPDGQVAGHVKNPTGGLASPRTFTHIEISKQIARSESLAHILDVCAHELHHAIQWSYMDLAGRKEWVLEASAAWLGYHFVQEFRDPDVNLSQDEKQISWYQFLDRVNYHQANPERSLYQTDQGGRDTYDAAIFFWFLAANRIAPGSTDLIKIFWDTMGLFNNWTKIYDAFGTALSGLAAPYNTLDGIFPWFAAANYSVSKWYPKIINTVKIQNDKNPHVLDFSKDKSHKIDQQTANVRSLSCQYFAFRPGSTLKKPTMLNIEVEHGKGANVSAVVMVKKNDGTLTESILFLDPGNMKGEIGVPGFASGEISEVVLALINRSQTGIAPIKYKAQLLKGFVFAIDTTGSMMEEIQAATKAAEKVLTDNMKKGEKRMYTLLGFADGPARMLGQSSDENVMLGYLKSLFAGGGGQCPESSLLSIRQAADLSEGADILMITDADSNSNGVDDTFADWGEAYRTSNKLKETNCKLNSIVYDSCPKTEPAAYAVNESNSINDLALPSSISYPIQPRELFLGEDDPSSMGGYFRVSTESGGLFFNIPSGETETAAEIILRVGTAESTVAYFDSSGTKSFTLPIDKSVSQLQVVLNGDTGSSLSIELKKPAGQTVKEGTPGVSILNVGTSTFYLIEKKGLATGDWKAQVSGTGTYRLSAEVSTSNPMVYTGEKSVALGSTLHMEANFQKSVPGLSFELIRIDGTQPLTVNLSSTDGFNYQGNRSMTDLGSYHFLAKGDGFYQRIHSAKISVGEVDVIAPPSKFGLPGTRFAHAFRVKNLGDKETTYDIYTSSSLGWADTGSVPSSAKIAGKDEIEIAIPVQIPSGALLGQTDNLAFQAVSQTNAMIFDTDETQTRIDTLFDFDGDGDVDVVDIMQVASRWNKRSGDPEFDAKFDLDGDGNIDIVDIMRVAAQWGWENP